ncbi:hypothetical protein [Roseateles sp.]|uniref:hypothetical protein n=1 Tax=Roseateles sp. TaxID=1971397 RepID=UPI0032654CD2
MNSLYRWITLSSLAAALLLVASASPAFTDSNAELKEAAADRTARVVVLVKAAPSKPTLYVPLATAKQLDGFKPPLPPERSIAVTRLAKAEAAR